MGLSTEFLEFLWGGIERIGMWDIEACSDPKCFDGVPVNLTSLYGFHARRVAMEA